MAKEIERKFKVSNDEYKTLAFDRVHIKQGYLSVNPDATVRVRIIGEKAFITVKGRNSGCVRDEWEIPVDIDVATEILEKCANHSMIEKVRYYIRYKGYVWEIDEFDGRNKGLVIAEIELNDADEQPDIPGFIGQEVTGDPAYYNSNLATVRSD